MEEQEATVYEFTFSLTVCTEDFGIAWKAAKKQLYKMFKFEGCVPLYVTGAYDTGEPPTSFQYSVGGVEVLVEQRGVRNCGV